jgi:hypothetical protein
MCVWHAILAISIGQALPAQAQSPGHTSATPSEPAIQAEATRQLGAHVHGTGQLSIAIERRSVEIELEVPAMDIVGFEHLALTTEQRQAVEKARTILSNPLDLIRLPAAAGCEVASAKAGLEIGGGHDHDQAKNDKDSTTPKAEDKRRHTEFHAEYTLTCTKPELIQTIEFDYFKVFPRAEALDVTLIGPRGQAKAKATRGQPRVELKGTS